jgi:DNA repair protein RadD
VDPNEKLHIEFTKIKKDPYTPTSDKLLSWRPQEWVSQAGNTTLRIDFTTEYRTFTVWYKQLSDCDNIRNAKAIEAWRSLCISVGFYNFHEPSGINEMTVFTAAEFIAAKPTMPRTITAAKERGTSFFRVIGYNQEELTE